MKYLLPVLPVLLMGCNSAITYPEGGYPYPKQIAPLDLNQYHYPIKDVVSKRDSFRNSYNYLFYQPFDEPNISLKPQQNEIFRLTYFEPLGMNKIITISKDGIIIKQGDAGDEYFIVDNYSHSTLTDKEAEHLSFLDYISLPIDTLGKDSTEKIFLRNELKKYPQLLDPFYHKMLYEKSLSSFNDNIKDSQYTYTTSYVSISHRDYKNWVMKLNESEYWQLPPEIEEIGDAAMDNPYIKLEANTQTKYNCVGKATASRDQTKFAKACQVLVNLAGLGKQIHIAGNSEELDED